MKSAIEPCDWANRFSQTADAKSAALVLEIISDEWKEIGTAAKDIKDIQEKKTFLREFLPRYKALCRARIMIQDGQKKLTK